MCGRLVGFINFINIGLERFMYWFTILIWGAYVLKYPVWFGLRLIGANGQLLCFGCLLCCMHGLYIVNYIQLVYL